MGDRSERFRRLKRDGRSGKRAAGTGDLFEHYGVEVEEAPATEPMTPAIEAAECRGCGWYLAYRRSSVACPICGNPDPLSAARGGTPSAAGDR